MALIEGVGDEVTALSGLLLALLVLALAWCSTRTAERGEPLFAAGPPPGQQEPQPDPDPARPGGPPAGGDLRHRPGPAPPPPPDGALVLRLKFLNDTERLARARPDDTVGALKRAYFPGQEQMVRLIYQGQLLRDDSQTLSALHLANNSVLHCHILQHRSASSVPNSAPADATHADAAHAALNVGSLMVPLFVLMLGALWYFQMQYRHVFTATATTCLAGLTLVFSFVAFAVYRR